MIFWSGRTFGLPKVLGTRLSLATIELPGCHLDRGLRAEYTSWAHVLSTRIAELTDTGANYLTRYCNSRSRACQHCFAKTCAVGIAVTMMSTISSTWKHCSRETSRSNRDHVGLCVSSSASESLQAFSIGHVFRQQIRSCHLRQCRSQAGIPARILSHMPEQSTVERECWVQATSDLESSLPVTEDDHTTVPWWPMLQEALQRLVGYPRIPHYFSRRRPTKVAGWLDADSNFCLFAG